MRAAGECLCQPSRQPRSRACCLYNACNRPRTGGSLRDSEYLLAIGFVGGTSPASGCSYGWQVTTKLANVGVHVSKFEWCPRYQCSSPSKRVLILQLGAGAVPSCACLRAAALVDQDMASHQERLGLARADAQRELEAVKSEGERARRAAEDELARFKLEAANERARLKEEHAAAMAAVRVVPCCAGFGCIRTFVFVCTYALEPARSTGDVNSTGEYVLQNL